MFSFLITILLRYIEFYLDLIGTADNIPLLYHLALKCKTVRDASSETYSEVCCKAGPFGLLSLISIQNLYCISELAQEIIKIRAKLNGWQLTSYPGKVKLPPDIFKGLASAEAANKVCFVCHWED